MVVSNFKLFKFYDCFIFNCLFSFFVYFFFLFYTFAVVTGTAQTVLIRRAKGLLLEGEEERGGIKKKFK